VTGVATPPGLPTSTTSITCTDNHGLTSGTCSQPFRRGTLVVLTATAATGSQFLTWSNCPAPSGNECRIALNEAITVTARFDVVLDALTVGGSGIGNGSFSATATLPGGLTSVTQINCASQGGTTSGTCAQTFPRGTSITVSAFPSNGYIFTSWSGCPSPSGLTCTVVLSGPITVTGRFDADVKTLQVNVTGLGTGTLSNQLNAFPPVGSSPAPLFCSYSGGTFLVGPCLQTALKGTNYRLAAFPASGYRFVVWSNCPSPSGLMCEGTLDASTTIGARFEPDLQLLTVVGIGQGGGTVTGPPTRVDPGIILGTGIVCQSDAGFNTGNCTQDYVLNTTITLTAIANANSHFAGWGPGCVTASGNTCTVFIGGAITLSARFDRNP